jgi:CheY-like chemotaxis protein
MSNDEESIRSTSTAILAQKGYEVRTAEDGFAALVELRHSLPDVIISDLRMPGWDKTSVQKDQVPRQSMEFTTGAAWPRGSAAGRTCTHVQLPVPGFCSRYA